MCRTAAAAKTAVRFVKGVLQRLGLRWKESKCHWEPVKALEHLGVQVDSATGRFSVTARRAAKLRAAAVNLRIRAAEGSRYVSAKLAAQFAGLAISTYVAVPCAKFFLRALYSDLGTMRGWRGTVKLSHQTLKDLTWWSVLPQKWMSAEIWEPPLEITGFTDASDTGWGGIMQGESVRGLWEPDFAPEHIAVKELRGARLVLEHFLPKVRHRAVSLVTDNTNVFSVLSRSVSRSVTLMSEFRKLWWLLDVHRIKLVPQWTPSELNPADAPSRQAPDSSWDLAGQLCAYFARVWGRPSAVYFRSSLNPFQQSPQWWRTRDALFLPTLEQCSQFVQLCVMYRPAGVVVTPLWRGQPWFTDLLACSDEVLQLPDSMGAQLYGPAAASWKVAAFRLSQLQRYSRPGPVFSAVTAHRSSAA
jgi:hypothetical protein